MTKVVTNILIFRGILKLKLKNLIVLGFMTCHMVMISDHYVINIYFPERTHTHDSTHSRYQTIHSIPAADTPWITSCIVLANTRERSLFNKRFIICVRTTRYTRCNTLLQWGSFTNEELHSFIMIPGLSVFYISLLNDLDSNKAIVLNLNKLINSICLPRQQIMFSLCW